MASAESKLERILLGFGFIVVAVIFSYGALLFHQRIFSSIVTVFLYTCLNLLFIMGILFNRILVKNAALIKAQKTKLEIQENAIATLREERHDILNELALASAYIQVGKYQEASRCIQFIAADLSDRYNYTTLPNDAWVTVIQAKQQEAQEQGIRCTIKLDANPPTCINERRLLPKLVFNLLDNALEAAGQSEDPWVELEWVSENGCRVLSVRNNGAFISDDIKHKIFEGGYSHKGGDRGWGLAICSKIASQLGGVLSVDSDENVTEFALRLPPEKPSRDGGAKTL